MAKAFKKDEAESPATTSEAHDIMAPRLEKMRALLGGTETMRAMGLTYLPRFENESPSAYRTRLNVAYLFNQTAMTAESWVGKVFREEPEIASLPKTVQPLFDDIDLQGNALVPFCREWFRGSSCFGLSYNLILMPPADAKEGGAARTLADDASDGRRPYWSLIAPENVLYARTGRRPNGEKYVSHLRVLGSRCVRKGFVDVEIPQITVYDETFTEVWELTSTRGGKDRWTRVGPPTDNPLGEVPLVVFYNEFQSDFVGRSPLFDIADINIRHWQSTSCQAIYLDVSRCPILAATGVYSEDVIEVGPRKFLKCEDPQGKFYYVESSGSSLMTGERELRMLQEQMDAYGSDFVSTQKTHITAASSILDAAGAVAPIEDAVVRFNDAVDSALYFTAKWLGIDPPPVGAVKFSVELPEPEDEPKKAPSTKPAKDDPEPKDQE